MLSVKIKLLVIVPLTVTASLEASPRVTLPLTVALPDRYKLRGRLAPTAPMSYVLSTKSRLLLSKPLIVTESAVVSPRVVLPVNVKLAADMVPVMVGLEIVGLVKVLFVKVWVVSVPTRVVVASGMVKVRVAPAVIPLASNLNLRVLSALSWTVNALSLTVRVGNVVIVVRPVPELLIATS